MRSKVLCCSVVFSPINLPCRVVTIRSPGNEQGGFASHEPEPECFPGKRQEGKTLLSANLVLSCYRPFGALCQQHWQLVRVTVTSSAASPLSHQINLSLAPQRKVYTVHCTVYITLGFSFVIVSSLMSSSMQGKAKRESDSLNAAMWPNSDWVCFFSQHYYQGRYIIINISS